MGYYPTLGGWSFPRAGEETPTGLLPGTFQSAYGMARLQALRGLLGCDDLPFETILNTFVSIDDDPSVRLDRTETAVKIRLAVARLPEKESEILTLAYFDQLMKRVNHRPSFDLFGAPDT
jgi:hypothetical protein